MGLEVPTWISDLVTTNPLASDPESQGDDHLRAIKTALRNSFPNASAAFYFPTVLSKTANYTVLTTDDQTFILADATAGNVTLTLTAAATLGARFRFKAMKIDSSANTVTIDPNGAETINGSATKVLNSQYEMAELFCNGTTFYSPSNGQTGDANTWSALNTFTLAGVPVRFVNTSDSASVQVAKFEGDRATMADADEAYISLLLSNDAGTQTEFARIGWVADDVNVGTSVDGSFFFSVVTAGALGKELVLNGTSLSPAVSDGNALGTTSLMWGDLFLASGGVINFNAGDVTITHSANLLTFAGASTGYSIDAKFFPATDDGAALGDATHNFSDLFLASGAVINFANSDITITHSANTLTFAGAASGYTFDVTPNVGGTSLVLTTRTLTAAGIVTGGGDLSANRTFTVTAAVQADQETASSNAVAVTPGVQHFHPSAAKMWGNTTGAGTPALQSSYNITSITDTGVGDLTITIATDFSSANWALAAIAISGSANLRSLTAAIAAGTAELFCFNSANALADPGGGYGFAGLGDL